MNKLLQKLRENKPLNNCLVIFASLFVGSVNGFFGGGGGMLVVPILTFLRGLEEKKAHATAVAIILPLSIATVIVYSISNVFEWKSIFSTSLGVLIGGIVGSFLLTKLSNKWLAMIFSLVMLASGIRLVIG